MRSYEELEVWQLAMVTAQKVYSLTRRLPKEELYGLASQMRRAAVSIPANIAEGYARAGRKEYLQFPSVARGSQAELATLLKLTAMVYPDLKTEDEQSHAARTGMMLSKLHKALSTARTPKPEPRNP